MKNEKHMPLMFLRMKEMIGLGKYPHLFKLMKTSCDFRDAISTLWDLYEGKKRASGRLMSHHCLETCELISHLTTDPIIFKSALFHDVIEDFGLSFGDVKSLSGKDGSQVARNVSILSKRADLRKKKERNREYMLRLHHAISNGDRAIGVIKISDRLSNLLDIQYLPAEKRKRIARQTLDFYLPIAFKLGLTNLGKRLMVLSLPHIGSERRLNSWK